MMSMLKELVNTGKGGQAEVIDMSSAPGSEEGRQDLAPPSPGVRLSGRSKQEPSLTAVQMIDPVNSYASLASE